MRHICIVFIIVITNTGNEAVKIIMVGLVRTSILLQPEELGIKRKIEKKKKEKKRKKKSFRK